MQTIASAIASQIARSAVVLTAMLGVSVGAVPAVAQQYPSRPVVVVVSFAAGSSTDSLARVIAMELQKGLGGSFVVDNKAGANGLVAAEHVMRAKPDGHTLLVTTHSSHAANISLLKKLPYDPLKDFTPIGRMTSGQFILAVNPAVGAKTVAELIAIARAKPGKLSYATSNSTSLVSAEWFKAIAGLDILGIPYKSNATAVTDLMAGRVELMFGDQLNTSPLVASGRLIGLALTGDKRSELAPGLPTMQEAGVKDFKLNSWSGLYGPARMPQDLVAKINETLNRALATPEVVENLKKFGYDIVPSTPEELGRFNAAEIEVWRTAVTAAKIEPQ